MKKILRAALDHLPARQPILKALRVIRPPKSVYSRLPFKGDFRVAVNGTGAFVMHSHGHGDENAIFWRGLFGFGERASMQLWVRLCAGASCIFDVGANWGLFSLVAAAANPKARIFGFEPVTPSLQIFRANVALNQFPSLEIIHAAVGNLDGAVPMFFNPTDPKQASLGGGAGAVREDVTALRLDTFVRQRGLPRLDLLKIDVETFEPLVLEGMGALLAQQHPTILIEVLNDEVGARLENLLPPDYLCFHVDEESGAQRRDSIRRISRKSRNYLLCSASQAKALGLS